LRRLIDDAAARQKIPTAKAFAEAVSLSPSTVSGVTSGDQLPSRETLLKILKATGVREEDFDGWQSRRDRALGDDPDPVPVPALREAAAAWDAAAPGETSYRPVGGLYPSNKLAELLTLAREEKLAALTGQEWAYLVGSAVHHGERYRRWFDLATASSGPIPVIETLVEQMVGPYRRPAWRAAWLLQFAADDLRRAAVRLAKDLAERDEQPNADPALTGLLGAVEQNAVEQYLEALPEDQLRAEVRRVLLQEFRTEGRPPAARGRLASYLEEAVASSGDVASRRTQPDTPDGRRR
jgi:transcriptional regulator with XRE-family HTH domain